MKIRTIARDQRRNSDDLRIHRHLQLTADPESRRFTMDSFRVRLKKANAPSQLLEFDAWPTWDELSWRIVVLYQIPHDKILLTFCNPDTHFVNLSNDEELQQLYKRLWGTYRYIKFVVQNSQALDGELVLPHPFHVSHYGFAPAASDPQPHSVQRGHQTLYPVLVSNY
jgi:hypothetical protein